MTNTLEEITPQTIAVSPAAVRLPDSLNVHPAYVIETSRCAPTGRDQFWARTVRIAAGTVVVAEVAAYDHGDGRDGGFNLTDLDAVEPIAAYLIAAYNYCQAMGLTVEMMTPDPVEDYDPDTIDPTDYIGPFDNGPTYPGELDAIDEQRFAHSS